MGVKLFVFFVDLTTSTQHTFFQEKGNTALTCSRYFRNLEDRKEGKKRGNKKQEKEEERKRGRKGEKSGRKELRKRGREEEKRGN